MRREDQGSKMKGHGPMKASENRKTGKSRCDTVQKSAQMRVATRGFYEETKIPHYGPGGTDHAPVLTTGNGTTARLRYNEDMNYERELKRRSSKVEKIVLIKAMLLPIDDTAISHTS